VASDDSDVIVANMLFIDGGLSAVMADDGVP
jgi:hypothetical protein